MVGLLWYNMLQELSKTGGDTESLGTGGDAYRGMFLWEIAQGNFGKYSTNLVDAILHQMDAGKAMAGSPAVAAAAPAVPGSSEASSGAAASALPVSQAAPDGKTVHNAEELMQAAWPSIRIAASLLGVPAVAVLAQAALETGWGAASPGNNLFGIKSDGSEASSLRATHEVVDGVLVPATAQFRDYASPQSGLEDYVQLIRESFPNAVGQKTVEGFAQALQAGGYATDTAYGAKIVSIARSSFMNRMLSKMGEDGSLTNP